MNWFRKKEETKECEHVYFCQFNSISNEDDVKTTGTIRYRFLLTCRACGHFLDVNIDIEKCISVLNGLAVIKERYKPTVLMRLHEKYKIMNKVDF